MRLMVRRRVLPCGEGRTLHAQLSGAVRPLYDPKFTPARPPETFLVSPIASLLETVQLTITGSARMRTAEIFTAHQFSESFRKPARDYADSDLGERVPFRVPLSGKDVVKSGETELPTGDLV
jgi:hypothetical protein